ncbi:hypothetical protein MMC07_008349 [Pseudocyphellaria aurata]|nr:hypothetical protein [Pseudocyphellaria aurata]
MAKIIEPQIASAPTPPSSLIEVDERASQDQASKYKSSSITSSVLDYEFENGRRYHAYKAGSYPLPNDEAELERIDIKHHVIMLLAGGHLHLAPLVSPMKILDIGTGTGIWAIEMADRYPDSLVIGTDLSPVQPKWVHDNVRFEIDDVESRDWTWRENYFDYIHTRFMIASISSWQAMLQKAFKHCKPGGYVELQELDPRFVSDDGSLRQDSALCYWSRKICEAAEEYNRPIPVFTEYKAWLKEAGFVDVQQVIFKSPTNSWPKSKLLKEASKFQLLAHIEGTEGISLGLMTRGLHWKAEEVKVLMARLRPELKNRSIHSYQTIVVVFGRKPDGTDVPASSTAVSGCGSAPLTPEKPFINPCSRPSPGENYAERLDDFSLQDSDRRRPEAVSQSSTPVVTMRPAPAGAK